MLIIDFFSRFEHDSSILPRLLKEYHYSDVTWTSWRLKSPAIHCLFNRLSTFHDNTKLHVTGLGGGRGGGINRWLVDSPHKGPATRKMVPFDYIIMHRLFLLKNTFLFSASYLKFQTRAFKFSTASRQSHKDAFLWYLSLCNDITGVYSLTHWSLVTPFGVIDLDQRWFM